MKSEGTQLIEELDKKPSATDIEIKEKNQLLGQEYRSKLKQILKEYREETADVLTKEQAKKEKKEKNRRNEDEKWEMYLAELRTKLAKIPPGITSIRKSIISLERKAPLIVKSEEQRQIYLKNYISARSKVVLEKRKKTLDMYKQLLPKIIQPEQFEEAIKTALENPQERNVSIENLVKAAMKKRRRILKLKPHKEDLQESCIITKPLREY